MKELIQLIDDEYSQGLREDTLRTLVTLGLLLGGENGRLSSVSAKRRAELLVEQADFIVDELEAKRSDPSMRGM